MMQQPGFTQMTPEEWLATRGKVLPHNPDETPADERVSMVMRFQSESEKSKVRQKAYMMWQESDRLMEGNHWSGHTDKLSQYQTGFVINKTYAVAEKLVSLLIANIPEVEILPRQSSMNHISEGLDNYIRHEYENNSWLTTVIVALKEAIKHRTGFLKIFWDAEADGGRGAIRLDSVSNYDLFLHPGAMIRDGALESKFIIHRMDKSRNEIIGKYGVDPTGEYQRQYLGIDNKQKQSDVNNFIDGVRDEMRLGFGGSGSTGTSRPPNYENRDDTYEVFECHYKDDQLVPTEGYGERQQRKLKYPAGRIITVCNGEILHDGPNHAGFCHFVPLTTDPQQGYIYGPSVITHLAGVQFAINKGFSQIYEHTERCSNPTMEMSSLTNGINQDSNIRAPGSRIVTAEGQGGVGWIEPPRLGPEVMQLIQIAIELVEDISGVYEVSQGESSPQARSGVAIEKLQAAAATRSNLRMKGVDEGIKKIYENACSLLLDNVSEERMYRFWDEDTAMEKFGTFNAKEMVLPTRQAKVQALQNQIDQAQMQFSVVQQTKPFQAAQLYPLIQQELMELQDQIYETWALPAHDLVSVDVRIQVGTRFMSKQQLANMAMVLSEMGKVADPHLFKILDWPGWRDNLRMIMRERQEMAEAERKAVFEQFDLERLMKEIEHANAMELEELEGTFELAKERLRLKAADKKSQESKAA